MWVPCLGMALCSWLSFVDRQVLTILAPTIIRDTGLTPQNFTDAASFFFLAYTLGNPVWGSILDFVGLRVGMLLAVAVWTGASASHALMGSFAGFAAARAVLGSRRRRDVPGRSAHGRRVAAGAPARPRDRAVVFRRHDRRGHDAAAARARSRSSTGGAWRFWPRRPSARRGS